ncbi:MULTISPECIES: DUF6262 family protein [unclassified Streptomyces]|uniref:DUF6262 family protein n=1 Tax=unclassified Streptomyces TaxID=2593676 RepID=UPI002E2424E5
MNTAMADGGKADTERRRQRVITAVKNAAKNNTSISVSAIARQTGVDRTFLYRHRDLLALVHAAELEPARHDPAGASPVSLASLQADLANAQARNTRLVTRVQQMEKRLSELMGEQAWRESGLGAPADVEELQRTITWLEQRNVGLASNLEEREAELEAARVANRELTRALNQKGATDR